MTAAPRFRQSLLHSFDACPLAAKWTHEGTGDWHSPEAALGTAFHSVAEEILRTLQRTGEVRVPTEEAVVIATEVLARPSTPHLSVRQQRDLQIMVLQFT